MIARPGRWKHGDPHPAHPERLELHTIDGARWEPDPAGFTCLHVTVTFEYDTPGNGPQELTDAVEAVRWLLHDTAAIDRILTTLDSTEDAGEHHVRTSDIRKAIEP